MATKTLTLTSPHTRGPLVKTTQKLLRGAGFNPGATDGEYGPSTAAAVRRAKWSLGYPDNQVNESAGELLRAYLSGEKKTSLLYRARAKRRASVVKSLGAKTIALAVSFIGTKESPPGTNLNPFGAWYGVNGCPWCAEFVSYVLAKSGYKYVARASRWAYCPYVLDDARRGHYGMKIITFAQATKLAKPDADGNRACIITLYDWGNDGVADHIGFFERATGISTFTAIEGNTGLGNDSNGGEVMRRDRSSSDVIAFILVSP